MNNTLVKIVVPIIGLGVALVMAFVAYFIIAAWWAMPPPVLGFGEGPEQPVHFPHTVHVTQAGIDCQFCHRTVSTDEAASVPAVAQCLFCHDFGRIDGRLSAPERRDRAVEEIAKFQAGENPIDWMRVHRMPDHVQFVHAPHIQRGIACNECHGDVAGMEVVRQVRALKMADCVDCHRDNNAPTDCMVCHY
jgi:hypothetical protein